MFDKLYEGILVSLPRAFLLAGLLPATLLVLPPAVYLLGYDGIAALLDEILGEHFQAGRFGVLLVLWLLLGGLIFSLRRRILAHLAQLSGGALLGWLGEGKLRRNRQKVRSLDAQRAEALWRYTVITWPAKDFYDPEWVLPKKEHSGDGALAIEDSSKGRGKLSDLAKTLKAAENIEAVAILPAEQLNIYQGLYRLYALGRVDAKHKGYVDEVAHWRSLASDSFAKTILKEIELQIQQEYRHTVSERAHFPVNEWLRPTVLGNAFEVLDDYAHRRYGIPTRTLWARLWPLLSADERAPVAEGKAAIETLVTHTFAWTVSALCIFLLTIHKTYQNLGNVTATAPDIVWGTLLTLAVCTLAATSYEGAVSAVRALHEEMVGLVDLKRRAVLEALGFPVTTVKEEIETFSALNTFFEQAVRQGPLAPGTELTKGARRSRPKQLASRQ